MAENRSSYCDRQDKSKIPAWNEVPCGDFFLWIDGKLTRTFCQSEFVTAGEVAASIAMDNF
ncbi:hypothetical protein RMSM_00550 [Rhodopirellula maiorica SM1]|uniref:Uncharacterized protein n=1 Tax=Rhodopirellula maiorica SM1 TaxID=1265738 RepID=M5RTA6_9BACT|nr:hypothetical protein RMSM_00550 [Rhodopirellula maiorica SM1]